MQPDVGCVTSYANDLGESLHWDAAGGVLYWIDAWKAVVHALDPATGKWTVMRVPYPMGFFAKSMDGRIDDPKAGWKGRGIWSTYATRTPWHLEGGKGTTSKAVKFQMRPDPLAN